MTMPIQDIGKDPVTRWVTVGILLLIAAGYFVFLYALYSRVTETDGYIQEFIEESLRRSNVPGTVVDDTRSNPDRTDDRD